MARRKPKTPDQIMMEAAQRRNLERLDCSTWGPNPDQPKLQAFAGIEPARDYLIKDDNIMYLTPIRPPVFMSLATHGRSKLVTVEQAHHGQALALLYAQAEGKAGAGERQEKVDGGTLHKLPNMGDREARARYMNLCSGIPDGHPRKAIQALCKAQVESDGPIDWRQVVQACTGEKEPHVQGYIVRQGLEALEEAFRVEKKEDWHHKKPA